MSNHQNRRPQPQQKGKKTRQKVQPRAPRGSGAKRAADVIVSLALVAVVGAGGWRFYQNMQPIAQEGDHLAVGLVTEPLTEAPTEPSVIYQNIAVSNDDIHKGSLILVNYDTAYEEFDAAEIVSIYEHKTENYHVSGTETSIRQPAMDALNEMLDAFYVATGHSDIIVISGYRTKEQQQALYDEDLEQTGASSSTRVALPGHSEHESGYSLDVSLYEDGVQYDYDGTGEYAWIDKNCANYGYILRYTEDKTDVTEIQAEPWHYRYVGEPHASYIMSNNVCLEEYLTLLKNYDNETPLRIINWDGEIYEVYYVPADGASDTTYVLVPPDKEYTISGNNSDGFIVTVDTGEIQKFEETQEESSEEEPADTDKPEENTDNAGQDTGA